MSDHNHIYAIIDSSTEKNTDAANIALIATFAGYKITIDHKHTDTFNNQPIGLIETKNRALNRMKSCISSFDDKKTHFVSDQPTFLIGMDSGLIPGYELNQFFGTKKYVDLGWYDIGICAVTMYKGNTFFKYSSYTNPLPIESSYSILMNENIANDQLSKACMDALNKLNNISVFNATNHLKVNTVIMFGTFDLFHDLHKRLIDSAFTVGTHVVIYVYNLTFKHKNDTKVKIHDDVQQRITTITQHVLTKHKNISVRRMCMSHPNELKKAIDIYSKQGSIAIMGGDDQFNDYDRIIKICSDTNTPIVSLNRGETKLKLCSSDIREKISCQRIANIYDFDLNGISPFFWKNRIRSLTDAKTYLRTKLSFLGLECPQLWKFMPKSMIDKRIIHEKSHHKKIILCLPGRTPSHLDRTRKIAMTIQNDFLPQDMHNNVSIYIASYEQTDYDTLYHLNQLNINQNYFGDDAMIFTQLLIMPYICRELFIEKYEDRWLITPVGQLESVESIINSLSNITLFPRSIGSVIALEMENSFRYCMLNLGFSENEIVTVAKNIYVLNICNLAPLDKPRLFNTVSITGWNDKKARQYRTLSIPTNDPINNTVSFTQLSETHYSVLATIPDRIVEIGSNKEIEDDNCHYTPLFTAFRQNDSNIIPQYIKDQLLKMVKR